MTLGLGIGFLILISVVLSLYVFGIFSTPYLEALRFMFYLVLVLLTLTIGMALMEHRYEGYDPTVQTR